jgi:hypothetical protein
LTFVEKKPQLSDWVAEFSTNVRDQIAAQPVCGRELVEGPS